MKSVLMQPGESAEYSFKVSMHGKTGRMHKSRVSSQPSTRWLEATMKELKELDEPTIEKIRPALEDCFKKTIHYLYTENQDEVVDELMVKIEKLSNDYDTLDFYSELEDFSDSFVEIVITTNLQQLELNPFLNIYDEEGDKVDSCRHGVETRLPEGKYKIECIAGEQKQVEEIKLDEAESLHFDFDTKEFIIEQQDNSEEIDKSHLKGHGVIEEKKEKETYVEDVQQTEEDEASSDKEPDSRNQTSKRGRKFRKHKRKLKRKVRWKINRFKKFVKKTVKFVFKLIWKAVKLIAIIAAFGLAYYFYNAYFAF